MNERNPFYNQPQWYPTPPTPFEQASRQGAAYVGGVLLTMSALTVGDYLHDYEQQHVLPYLKAAHGAPARGALPAWRCGN